MDPLLALDGMQKRMKYLEWTWGVLSVSPRARVRRLRECSSPASVGCGDAKKRHCAWVSRRMQRPITFQTFSAAVLILLLAKAHLWF